MRITLDPFTLRHVARWHRKQRNNAHADAADHASSGNIFAQDRANAEAEEHDRSARHWSALASSLTKARKKAKAR